MGAIFFAVCGQNGAVFCQRLDRPELGEEAAEVVGGYGLLLRALEHDDAEHGIDLGYRNFNICQIWLELA